MIGEEEINDRFGYHPPDTEEKQSKHVGLRVEFKEMANYLDRVLPDGRAKSVSLTELENCSMWAHKAVAQLSPVVDE